MVRALVRACALVQMRSRGKLGLGLGATFDAKL